MTFLKRPRQARAKVAKLVKTAAVPRRDRHAACASQRSATDRLENLPRTDVPPLCGPGPVVTCQGRDHIVNIRSGCQSLVVVNVHFEPDLTLRSLRERLRLITPHWPQFPDAIGMIMGDLKENSMSGIKLSPMVTWGKLLCFILYFLEFSNLPSLTILGETPQSMWLYARCQGLIELLSTFLWLKRATSIATPCF